MRNSMRLSSATPALRSTMACWTSIAQRTASTTLRNSITLPSPVRLTMRPWCTEIVGIDQVAAERPQPRQNPVFVCPGKPRIADHVGHQDRGELSGLAHGAMPPRPCQPFRVVWAKPPGGIAMTREEYRS